MNKQKTNARGITLVALVITIIVLVILVGVTLSVTLNTGLINNSKTAVSNYGEEQSKEEQQIIDYELMMDLKSTNSQLKVSNGATANIPLKTTVEEVLKQYPQNAGYAIYPKEGIELDENGEYIEVEATETLATGMIIGKNGKEMSRIVIYGDVNCDGKITTNDNSAISVYITYGYVTNGEEIMDCQKVAMDVNHDGIINMDDDNLIAAANVYIYTIPQNVNASNPSTFTVENTSAKEKYLSFSNKNYHFETINIGGDDYDNLTGVAKGTVVGDLLKELPENTVLLTLDSGGFLDDTDTVDYGIIAIKGYYYGTDKLYNIGYFGLENYTE